MLLALLSASESDILPTEDLSINLERADIKDLQTILTCAICDKVVGFAVNKITTSGCGISLEDEMSAVCEAAGLVSGDLLKDACVVTMIKYCGKIASMIAQDITNPSIICNTLHLCY